MKIYAFFDVDNVLVQGQSQKFFAEFLFKKGKLPLLLFLEIVLKMFWYNLGVVRDLEGLRLRALAAVKGWQEEDLQKLCQQFFDDVLRTKVQPQAVAILKQHLKEGHGVVLVSASLFNIVDLLRKELGAEQCIATHLELSDQGRCTGRVEGLVPYGPNKVTLLEEFLEGSDIDKSASYVYSDHISDIGMLGMFGHPVAVDPDVELEEQAKAAGWKVIRF